jgi:hypothetical protein
MRLDARDHLSELAHTFAALGHPLRLQLLSAFDEHRMSPTELKRRGGPPVPLASWPTTCAKWSPPDCSSSTSSSLYAAAPSTSTV